MQQSTRLTDQKHNSCSFIGTGMTGNSTPSHVPTCNASPFMAANRRMDFFHFQSLKTTKNSHPFHLLSQYSCLYSSSLSIGTAFLLAGATLACASVMNASREKQSIPSTPRCCSFSTAPKAERLPNCRLWEQETALACMRLIFRMH